MFAGMGALAWPASLRAEADAGAGNGVTSDGTASDAAKIERVYFIGNSLTWDSRPVWMPGIGRDFGRQIETGYHILENADLTAIVQRPQSAKESLVKPARFPQALADASWDVLCLQIHATSESTLGGDVAAVKRLVEAAGASGATPRVAIHSGWPSPHRFAARWEENARDLDGQPTRASAAYLKLLVTRLRGQIVSPVSALPVGAVLDWIYRDLMKQSENDQFAKLFFRDQIHMTHTLGRVAAAWATYGLLYPDDPVAGLNFTGDMNLRPEEKSQLPRVREAIAAVRGDAPAEAE